MTWIRAGEDQNRAKKGRKDTIEWGHSWGLLCAIDRLLPRTYVLNALQPGLRFVQLPVVL